MGNKTQQLAWGGVTCSQKPHPPSVWRPWVATRHRILEFPWEPHPRHSPMAIYPPIHSPAFAPWVAQGSRAVHESWAGQGQAALGARVPRPSGLSLE